MTCGEELLNNQTCLQNARRCVSRSCGAAVARCLVLLVGFSGLESVVNVTQQKLSSSTVSSPAPPEIIRPLWKSNVHYCVEKKTQLDVTECFIALNDMLKMFRALLCPSSGARDYMCVITAYDVQCLVAGCRGSGAEQPAMRSE